MKKLSILAFALVLAPSAVFAQNNSATVSSTGNNNQVTVSQAGQDLSASVTQASSSNAATVQQGPWGPGHTAADLTATISQSVGNGNVASIKQAGYGSPSGAGSSAITQQGTSNQAYTDIAVAFGTNRTVQTQIGNSNYASIKGQNIDAEQYQAGDANQAFAVAGDGETLRQTQIGGSNQAIAYGLSWSTATQYQSGDRNFARVAASNDGSVGGGAGVAPVYQSQTGSDNVSDMLGFSDYSSVYTYQAGDRNKVYGTFNGQDHNTLDARQFGGSDNFAQMTFTGALNIATVLQNGSSNSAVVTQGN